MKQHDRSWIKLLSFFAVTTLGSSLFVAAMLTGVTVAFGSGEPSQAGEQLADPIVPGQTFSGTITDARCGARHLNSEAEACVRTCVRGGSRYVLATNSSNYELVGNKELFGQLAGKPVNLIGTLEGNSITVSSAIPQTRVGTGTNQANDSGDPGGAPVP